MMFNFHDGQQNTQEMKQSTRGGFGSEGIRGRYYSYGDVQVETNAYFKMDQKMDDLHGNTA